MDYSQSESESDSQSDFELQSHGTIQDSGVPPTTPAEPWHYPPFALIVDTIRRHIQINRSSGKPKQKETLYTLKEGFVPIDRAWMKYVRGSRMRHDSKVLFRPNIVKTQD
mmetsp:Transcript_115464/g.226429  ORF Transcript_115464/g.226429 Transcript_115464/m.226429 type:complete len:110 (-) Transcript_115464:101-430(-)